jgi:malate synthase
MADFEDANVPTWNNVIEGQYNLCQAIDRKLTFTNAEGKVYQLNEQIAVLMVRPRGWHLSENNLLIDGEPISASIFDFGLYFYHNAQRLLDNGSGPYFYLPKMESHLEARLWNDIFVVAQHEMSIPQCSIKATVLIETILAVFEMDLILFELRKHSAGLNAGRWDYIFSIIKKFQKNEKVLFPDRGQISMTVPFMRAYTELLVKTCHRRGAQAMGGMAAYIPSRKDKEINDIALEKVREDKRRESKDGFDGTWVAHPDLVPIAREIFVAHLGKKPNQIDVKRDDVKVTAKELLNFTIPKGDISELGLRQNIAVALNYLESWLRGIGAVAIDNLMEDTATAEISRAQLWQWLHNPKAKLDNGQSITPELYQKLLGEEFEKIKNRIGKENIAKSKFAQAKEMLNRLVTDDQFAEFLTLSEKK